MILSAAPSPTDPRAERLLAALAELTEIGLDLARDLRAEVQAAAEASPPAPAASQDAALRFSRIARAVRQSVALEARLAAELAEARPATPTQAELKRQAEADRATRRKAGFERKATAAYLVCRTLESLQKAKRPRWTRGSERAPDDSDADYDRMEEGVAEWLYDAFDDSAYADRPMGEIILDICRAVGVAPDPDLWGAGEFEAKVMAAYAGVAPLDADLDDPPDACGEDDPDPGSDGAAPGRRSRPQAWATGAPPPVPPH